MITLSTLTQTDECIVLNDSGRGHVLWPERIGFIFVEIRKELFQQFDIHYQIFPLL